MQTDRENLTLPGREHLSLLDDANDVSGSGADDFGLDGDEEDEDEDERGFGDQTMAVKEALAAQSDDGEYFDPERSI